MQILLSFFLLAGSLTLFAQTPEPSAVAKVTVLGDVFDMSGKTKLFNYTRSNQVVPGGVRLKNEFRDLKGGLAVEEVAQLKNGKLVSYKVDQKQTSEKGAITVKGSKVHFSRTDAKGVTKTDSESLTENFVIGMTLIPYLASKWSQLMKGDSVKVRLGVWSRSETVGFKFWKDSEKGEKVVIVMKPTSYIIRALVDALYFTFNKQSKELLEIKGRTTPKIKKNGKWTDLDALIRYRPGPG